MSNEKEAIIEFAERLKNYYKHLKGQSYAPMIVYQIDQVLKEFLEGQNG